MSDDFEPDEEDVRRCDWCDVVFGSIDGVVPTEKGLQHLCLDHVKCNERHDGVDPDIDNPRGDVETGAGTPIDTNEVD